MSIYYANEFINASNKFNLIEYFYYVTNKIKELLTCDL